MVHGRRTAAAALAGCAALLSGCSSAQQPDVEHIATQFEDQHAAASARCDLLAPATRSTLEKDASSTCSAALGKLSLTGGSVRSVQVWGGGAQVKLAGDTLFLTETSSGWRVAAAGCTPQGDQPYDCQVEGP